MKIEEIISKLLKGESLTDDEKSFAEEFNLQAEVDKTSASARREGEKKAKDAVARANTLQQELDTLKQKLEDGEATKKAADSELSKLAKKIAQLEKKNAENEAAIAASVRNDTIRDMAKAAGISAADGISEKALEALVHLAVGNTDVTDEDAMKAVFEQFKADNPSMIAAATKQGAGVRGEQGKSAFAGLANPWKKDSFNLTKQIEIATKEPQLAATMKAEAGVAADS